jgi:pyridoxine kinase
VANLEEARAAAATLAARGPRLVVATGIEPAQAGEALIGALLVAREGGAWLAQAPCVAAPASGAGDLFAALFLGHLLAGRGEVGALERAVTATHAVLARTAALGASDLALIAAQAELEPRRNNLFKARRMG